MIKFILKIKGMVTVLLENQVEEIKHQLEVEQQRQREKGQFNSNSLQLAVKR
jgi:hypothetical protein